MSASALPGELDLIGRACAATGVPGQDARLLRRHANAVFLLPSAGLVLRLGAPGERSLAKARRAVAGKRLLDAYADLRFALPAGLIHADAADSNLLWDGDRPLLADWDAVCHGPREQDLAITHQNARFGLPAAERQAFPDRYDFDVTTWDGYPVLRDIHELHTLTSFIRLAPTDPAARAQLGHRITCLRNGDRTTAWTAF